MCCCFFAATANTVKQTLQESCVNILLPKRRIDILRDAMECKQKGRPYCVTFCGVNGVGKSTNLAKVRFLQQQKKKRFPSSEICYLNLPSFVTYIIGICTFMVTWILFKDFFPKIGENSY